MIDEFQLIQLVNLKPEIWDTNCVQFRNKITKAKAWQEIAASRNKITKAKAWQEIAASLNSISEDCLSTWRKLRDRYTRTKRVLSSGSEGGRKPWDKEQYMRFLDKVLVSRKYVGVPWDKEQYMRFLDKMLVSRKTISSAGTQNIENNNITSPTVENATTEENTLSQGSSVGIVNEVEQEEAFSIFLGSSISPGETLDHLEEFSDTTLLHTAEDVRIVKDVSIASPTTSSAASISTNTAKKMRYKGKNRKRNVDGDAEMTTTLINAINKLTEAPDDRTTSAEPMNVNEAFINFHIAQIRELMSNKTPTMQRHIRNRLNAFVDELFIEFHE
ncbi:Alcohol dehydrogenase transcription factor Myb/SANT-like [Popillia japonica]|uniref:Alcohol dehydrogenase transcription factor Myb/SANT-like n=1 Tax=Popillia japonica TaxID=7064 RepID=A0AAW1K179_POPJA